MKIVTVTLNPALDKTAVVDELQPGELNRLREVMVDAGGKGVNVSKMIAALGGASLATGFVGGGSGEEIVRALDAWDIEHDFVRVSSATRTNLKVLDRVNRLTELNEPGPVIADAELASLFDKLRGWAGPDTLFVFSGSVPRGVGADVYADFTRMVRQAGALAFLDADGPAFAKALEEGPSFIKPNRHELLEYFDIAGAPDLREMAGLCRRLLDKGVSRIAMSMGRDGALFVTGDETFFAPGLTVKAQSSVGAGDSMVGAVACGTAAGMPWRDIAALAMAASAGAVTTAGTKPPEKALVAGLLAKVELRELA